MKIMRMMMMKLTKNSRTMQSIITSMKKKRKRLTIRIEINLIKGLLRMRSVKVKIADSLSNEIYKKWMI